MDIYINATPKPSAVSYVLTCKPDLDTDTEESYEKYEHLHRKVSVFDDLETALFALDEISKLRGHDIPVGWQYVVRRVEKNKLHDPQDVPLVSWKRIEDTDGQRLGTSSGDVIFYPYLKAHNF